MSDRAPTDSVPGENPPSGAWEYLEHVDYGKPTTVARLRVCLRWRNLGGGRIQKLAKPNAFACGVLLLATGTAKLSSRLSGSLIFNGPDPVIGLPISTIATCVAFVELVLGSCLLAWPASLHAHAFQVGLFACFAWYRVLLSKVLKLNFACYCAGGIFHASPFIDAVVHQLLTLIFWPLLLFSGVLFILRLLHNESGAETSGSFSECNSKNTNKFQGRAVTGALLVLAILHPATTAAGDAAAKRVTGVLYDVDYGPDGVPKSTNAFRISGVIAGDNYLLDCQHVRHGSELMPSRASSPQGQSIRLSIGSENGIIRTIVEETTPPQTQDRISVTAQVEPYLVPRVLNKPAKVAILALTQSLPLKLKTTRYPLFMSKYPPYPIFNVEVVAQDSPESLQVVALLKRGRKPPQSLWRLSVHRHARADALELNIMFRERIPGFPSNDVMGTLRLEPTTLPPAFRFRPPIAPGTRVLDYTLIDQMQVLKATDPSREIWGAVAYVVTNAMWEYDLNGAQQTALVVSRAAVARANPRMTGLVRLAFVAGCAILLLAPLVLLKLQQAAKRAPNHAITDKP